MNTQELLEKATARPWRVYPVTVPFMGYEISNGERGVCRLTKNAVDDAALIARAVNSFESLTQFVEEVDGLIRRGVGSDRLWKYCVENREAALALAEGKAA